MPKRAFCALLAVFAVGCASRSRLHGAMSDAAEPTDTEADADEAGRDVGPETWSVDVGTTECGELPNACALDDDFGPSRAVEAVFLDCTAAVGKQCGKLRLVFGADGCLSSLNEISFYSPAFVECVGRVSSAKVWPCGAGKALTMFEACAP